MAPGRRRPQPGLRRWGVGEGLGAGPGSEAATWADPEPERASTAGGLRREPTEASSRVGAPRGLQPPRGKRTRQSMLSRKFPSLFSRRTVNWAVTGSNTPGGQGKINGSEVKDEGSGHAINPQRLDVGRASAPPHPLTGLAAQGMPELMGVRGGDREAGQCPRSGEGSSLATPLPCPPADRWLCGIHGPGPSSAPDSSE
ncbi:unnamed protein product [Rangifer tarandus platyrhynchus]|uniref:Uncharacterized protein n=1 Tax=Rangifer tarandus platyrhynchus TaxID=3082113 RepID=A0AC59Z7X2_RANTA